MVCPDLFLCAFAKLRKAIISFVMSVRSSVRMEKLGSRWTDFREILYLNTVENLLRKFKFQWNLIRITGTLDGDLCTFMILYLWIVFRMRSVSDRVVERIKKQILCSVTFLENCAVYEITWKNTVQPDTPQMAIYDCTCVLHPG